MIQSPLRILIPLACLLFAQAGCGNPKDKGSNSNRAGNSAESQTAGDDIESLRVFAEIPEDAEDVVWRSGVVDAAEALRASKKEGSRRLVAVLRFEGKDAQAFDARLKSLGKGNPATVAIENWFPAELVAKGQTESEETLRGVGFPADGLVKEPFSEGRLVRIEGTPFYILEMYSR